MIDLLEVPKLVINLDRRKDRMVMFDAEFKSFFGQDQSYERVAAIKGTSVMRAIAASHMKAIAQAKERGYGMVCVMEDDVRFTSKKSFGYAQRCFNAHPAGWDLLMGGVFSEQVEKEGDVWVKLRDFSGLHFYLAHENAYDTILGMDVDMHIDRWIAASGLGCYTTRKIFATQHAGYSDNMKKFVSYDGILRRKFV